MVAASSEVGGLVERASARTGLALQLEEQLSSRDGLNLRLRADDGRFLLKAVEMRDDGSKRARDLVREADLIARLSTANGVSRSIAAETSSDITWTLQRWVDGLSLWEQTSYARSITEDEGRLDTRLLIDFLSVARALSALLRLGYLHGDVQPLHFIFRSTREVVVVDLESCVAFPLELPTGYGGGMLHFAAPEVAEQMLVLRNRDVRLTPAAEVFALGSVLYYCLCGNVPFDYGAIDSLHDDAEARREAKLRVVASGQLLRVDDRVAAAFPNVTRIIEACHHRDAARRPASVVEVVDYLASLGGDTA